MDEHVEKVAEAIRTASIAVKHNIEVAHRLYETPGKCENIHGHSMWVTLELVGHVNDKGLLGSIEFGELKSIFRQYLDEVYDHHLLLNAADPFSRALYKLDHTLEPGESIIPDETSQLFLPGLQSFVGDPTTENIATWIHKDMSDQLLERDMIKNLSYMRVEVWETSVNQAKVGGPL